MNTPSELTAYMNQAVERLFNKTLKSAASNPREAALIVRFAALSKSAAKKRLKSEEAGIHVPAFIIASITSQCNLFCKGCYARARHIWEESEKRQLTAGRWGGIFHEAQELGVGFILLAGGEPLMRRDVIEQAAAVKTILFPLFTNGTMLNEDTLTLLDKNRHIFPVLSMEGDAGQTDGRRGGGISEMLTAVMGRLQLKGIYYGVSITVTTENILTVTSETFIRGLHEKGCKIVFFIEFVPMSAGSEDLAPTEKERGILEDRQRELRVQFDHLIFLSFPGDEKLFGGCIAAGRGFFHINETGGAEPCPFSPYSDMNLKYTTILSALKSPFFLNLQESGLLSGEHKGGCTLFTHNAAVKELLSCE